MASILLGNNLAICDGSVNPSYNTLLINNVTDWNSYIKWNENELVSMRLRMNMRNRNETKDGTYRILE